MCHRKVLSLQIDCQRCCSIRKLSIWTINGSEVTRNGMSRTDAGRKTSEADSTSLPMERKKAIPAVTPGSPDRKTSMACPPRCSDRSDVHGSSRSVGRASLANPARRDLPPLGSHSPRAFHSRASTHTLLVQRTLARRLNARPRDGIAIAAEMQLLHDRNVFGVAVVVVAGDVAGPTSLYIARGVTETIPDGFASSVEIPRPIHLIGRGCATPQKAFRESSLAGFGALGSC